MIRLDERDIDLAELLFIHWERDKADTNDLLPEIDIIPDWWIPDANNFWKNVFRRGGLPHEEKRRIPQASRRAGEE